ncbi:MAG: type II toxin-antitoxin system RatA family toxin [Rhodospirillales bacterium]
MPTHAEKRHLRHSPDHLFDLVADVGKYPDFLPWCIAARKKKEEGDVILWDLIIGFKMVRERFTSRVTLDRENRRIDVTYLDGPFRYLNNHWIFLEHEDGCLIDFYVDFEFRSKMLSKLMGMVFSEAVQLMVRAFEKRANALYGTPDGPTKGN